MNILMWLADTFKSLIELETDEDVQDALVHLEMDDEI